MLFLPPVPSPLVLRHGHPLRPATTASPGLAPAIVPIAAPLITCRPSPSHAPCRPACHQSLATSLGRHADCCVCARRPLRRPRPPVRPPVQRAPLGRGGHGSAVRLRWMEPRSTTWRHACHGAHPTRGRPHGASPLATVSGAVERRCDSVADSLDRRSCNRRLPVRRRSVVEGHLIAEAVPVSDFHRTVVHPSTRHACSWTDLDELACASTCVCVRGPAESVSASAL